MKQLLLMCLILECGFVQANNWYLVDENQNTQMFVDNDSLLVDNDMYSSVEYTNILVSKDDFNPNFSNNFKLIAHVVDDCANTTQSIVSVKLLDADNLLVKNSKVMYQTLQPQRINIDSQNGKAHQYACKLGSKYRPLTPKAEEIASYNRVIPKESQVEDNYDETKVYRFSGKDWMYVAKNDKAVVYVEPTTIKYNQRKKIATFFTKLESLSDTKPEFPQGSYIVSQNVANCINDTTARLYVSLYSKSNERLNEQRFTSKDIKFIDADPQKLNGKVQKYVCDIKLASQINN